MVERCMSWGQVARVMGGLRLPHVFCNVVNCQWCTLVVNARNRRITRLVAREPYKLGE